MMRINSMTVKEFANKFDFEILCGDDSLNREIETGYCCDLLSLVMGRAPSDCVWLTIMGNLNAVAVASLADISAILLCEDVKMDADGLKKAKEEDIAVLSTSLPIFQTVCKISEIFDF
jgi:predicted transcriptional regulator